MAISYLGIARRTSVTQWDLTQRFPDVPTGPQSTIEVDDLMVIFGNRAGAVTNVTVSGWTPIFGGPIRRVHGSTNRNVGIGLWWKFRTSTDTTVTLPNMDSLSVPGNYTIFVFRGVNKTNPFDVTPDPVAHVISGASVPNPPPMTPVTVGAFVAYWGCNWTASGTRDLLWNAPITGSNFRIESYSNFNNPSLPYRFGFFPNWSSGVVDGTMSSVYGDASIVPALVFRPDGAAPTGGVKVWDGSAWTAKPVKVWDGTAWVTKPVKVWNGTAWVTTPY